VLGFLALAQQLGVLHQLRDPAAAARSLVALGALGYLAFVVAYAVFQPFGVPGTVFILAAPLVWPWPIAFALSMTGTMAASVVGFSFARLVARDWVAARIPPRLRRYDDALAAHAFVTIFLLRLVFWMPPALHAFFGVSRVRFSTHFWASFAGYLTPVFLVSFLGARLFEAVRHLSVLGWVEVSVATVVVGTGLAWAVRRYEPVMSSVLAGRRGS
jgi:uncharacterized membrane protein YdjX (TVP38/TMEM64 family)